MKNQLRLGIDAFMSATDNAADCHACMVFSAFGFGLGGVLGLDIRRKTLIRVGPKSDDCEN